MYISIFHSKKGAHKYQKVPTSDHKTVTCITTDYPVADNNKSSKRKLCNDNSVIYITICGHTFCSNCYHTVIYTTWVHCYVYNTSHKYNNVSYVTQWCYEHNKFVDIPSAAIFITLLCI